MIYTFNLYYILVGRRNESILALHVLATPTPLAPHSLFNYTPFALHMLTTPPPPRPLAYHSLPDLLITRSPLAPYSLSTCSPLALHLLITCSPHASHLLINRSPLAHHTPPAHLLTTRSLLAQ